MSKRKVLMIGSALILALAMFAGCSGTTSDQGAASTEAVTSAASVEPAASTSPESTQTSEESTSGTETGSKSLTIGVSMQGLTAPYIAGMAQHFEEIGKEMGLNVMVLDGQEDATTQNNQIDNFIEQGVDAIVFNPISYDGGAPGVDAAVAAGIPIIIAQTSVSNVDKAVTYVGSSHYENGKMEIEGMIKDVGNKCKIVVMEGVMGIDAQIDRMKAYEDVIAENPGIEVVAKSNADWDRAKGMQLVENWLSAGDEFDVVLSQNDNMALGAVEALRSHDLLGKVKVYGIDGDADALMSIQAGEMTATSWQDSENIARKALEACVKAANGETVEKNINVPGTWVTKDNVADYLK